MKEQLTLEMLCSYLPYGLKVKLSQEGIINLDLEYPNERIHQSGTITEFGFSNGELNGILTLSDKYSFDFESLDEINPIFRNLKTDLTREIEHNGERFVPIEILEMDSCELSINKYSGHIEIRPLEFNEWIYAIDAYTEIIQKLISWHFWIYDQFYFEKGIILDINELNK